MKKKKIKTNNVKTDCVEDPKEVISYISDPKYRIVTITLHPELLDWVEKIVEKLKEVETQGLKYVIFHLPIEGLPEKVKEEIEGKSSIPVYIIGLLKDEAIIRAKSRLLEFFGSGIKFVSEFESLDSWWNSFQRKLEEIQEKRIKEVYKDKDINFKKLDNETISHYLMKAIVYKYLKLRGYEVKVEEPFLTGDQVNTHVNIPDLKASKNGEEIVVEIETGYPTEEEKEEYRSEVINPEERIMSEKKLGKYTDTDVRLVVPNLFAIVHRRMLKKLKGYFKTKLNVDLTVYTVDWSSYPCKLIKMA